MVAAMHEKSDHQPSDRATSESSARSTSDSSGKFAFELNNISFTYPDGVLGVEIERLGIRRGCCTILLGANGSGKSTLLKILDGLLYPQEGSLRAFGESVTEKRLDTKEFQRRFRSRVGFVFQDADIQCFSPTVRDELAFGPLQRGLAGKDIDLIVQEALSTLRIESIADRYPYRLSGGEKKRVAIASVLTMDPETYLLDEPTANLDPATEGILIDILAGFAEEGKTVVVATQDLMLARHIGDRAVILGPDRRLAAEGEITGLLDRPELLASAGLAHYHRHPHRKASAHERHPHYTEDDSG